MTDPTRGAARQQRDMSAVVTVNRAEAAAFIGGAAALAGSWALVVARETVPPAEARAFEIVNGLPDALWPVVWLPMQAGSFLGSLAVVGLAAAATHDRRAVLAALVASQGAFWTAKVVKAMVSRERPAALLDEIHVRETADGFGYVSGHAAVAFALATALAPSLPRSARPAVFATAVVVGFGRIYGGAHLPLDVVGGAGIGLLFGTVTRWALGLGGEGLPRRR
ncbi:MAG: phosphatase PAP2 family protein [Acidimicrobiales bacterium]